MADETPKWPAAPTQTVKPAFQPIDPSTTPKPRIDDTINNDPFRGNENNRRAFESKSKNQRFANEPAPLVEGVTSTSQAVASSAVTGDTAPAATAAPAPEKPVAPPAWNANS